jgi:hypothetical protein
VVAERVLILPSTTPVSPEETYTHIGIAIQQGFQSSWIFAGPTQFQLDPARIQHCINFFLNETIFLNKHSNNFNYLE